MVQIVGQGRAVLGLTPDGQGGFTLLVTGYKRVLPSVGPLHVVNEESVHEAVLLQDDSILASELETGATAGAGHSHHCPAGDLGSLLQPQGPDTPQAPGTGTRSRAWWLL